MNVDKDVNGFIDSFSNVCSGLTDTKESEDLVRRNKEALGEITRLCSSDWTTYSGHVKSIKTKRESIEKMLVESRAELAKCISQTEQKKTTAEQRLESLLAMKEALEQTLQKLIDDNIKIDEKIEQAKSAEIAEIRRTVDTFKLYKNITRLRWNFEAEPHLCEGFVSRKNDTIPFSISQEQSSLCDIAYHLWNLIDEEAGHQF